MRWALLACVAAVVLGGQLREYNFSVRATVWAPDGFPRPVLSYWPSQGTAHGRAEQMGSAPFPGPLIRLRVNDTLRVAVSNHLHSEIASVHWHGLHNLWQDGVPGVTECGIAPFEQRVYEFVVRQSGTYWYHSHTGGQYHDGLLGPIVIDPEGDDAALYGYNQGEDYVAMMQDWHHETWTDLMGSSMSVHAAYPGFKPFYPFPPPALLLNGHGRFNCSQMITHEECNVMREMGCQCLPMRPSYFGSCGEPSQPAPVFRCSGAKMRLRLINAAANMPLRFWIDEHRFVIIAQDGMDIRRSPEEEPLKTILIPVGQRVDILVLCNHLIQTKAYRVMVSVAPAFIPAQPCGFPNISTWGWMKYPSSADGDKTFTNPGFNSADPELFDDLRYEEQLNTFDRAPPLVPRIALPAKQRIMVVARGDWEMGVDGTRLEYWMVNGKSWSFPSEPFLPHFVRTGEYPLEMKKRPDAEIVRLEVGEVYEVVCINLSMQQHPWHLHGYTIDFVDRGFFDGGNAVEFNGSFVGSVASSEPAAVVSCGDSFLVPQYGWTTFRFRADAPGPHLFHCHVEWHMMMGMAMMFSVEPYTSVGPPPPEWPVCGFTYAMRKTMHEDDSRQGLKMVVMVLAVVLFCLVVLAMSAIVVFIGWKRIVEIRSIGKKDQSSKMESVQLTEITHDNEHTSVSSDEVVIL